jgi:hypothetical protein
VESLQESNTGVFIQNPGSRLAKNAEKYWRR